MPLVRHTPSFSALRAVVAFSLVCVNLFAGGELLAEETKSLAAPAAGSAVVSEPQAKKRITDAAREKHKEETINTAYVLFGGVLLLLVALFTLILLGGSWARRLARTPLPPVKRPDELWYLKNPQTPESEETAEQTPATPPSDES